MTKGKGLDYLVAAALTCLAFTAGCNSEPPVPTSQTQKQPSQNSQSNPPRQAEQKYSSLDWQKIDDSREYDLEVWVNGNRGAVKSYLENNGYSAYEQPYRENLVTTKIPGANLRKFLDDLSSRSDIKWINPDYHNKEMGNR